MSTQMKQLKKNEFLAVLTETPMTKGQLVDALDEFEYIPTYLDFLIDHFKNQGKIVIGEAEISGDPTFARKGKKSGGPRNVFRIIADMNGPADSEDDDAEDVLVHSVESKEITGNMSDEDKAAGWSMTKKAAIKKACSDVFAQYKADTANIKLLDVEDAPAEESEAA
tara:strand:+ start:10089 stop:10589 length:501 start_codon:yes stop_codon:yes gene_type:complete